MCEQTTINDMRQEIAAYKLRYQEGMKVVYQGQDESDDICCPICGNSLARNDDFTEFRPKHCLECGTRVLY